MLRCTQEGTPAPATPNFDEDTELRMEVIIGERVSARLMAEHVKGRDAGYQQV